MNTLARCVLAAPLALACAAAAQPLPEVEPNNTIPGPPLPPHGIPFYAITGQLAPGDFDAFDHGPLNPFPNIVPVFGACVTAATWTDPLGAGDTLLGEWFAGLSPPMVFAVDDDENPGRNSGMQWNQPYGPPLTHLVTGSGDPTFIGHHLHTTPYCLVVSSWGAPEFEPNNTPPLANPMPPLLHGATAVEGILGPPGAFSDVDMFTMPLPAGAYVTVGSYDFSAPPLPYPPVDTLIGVLDPAGFTYADDSEGPALGGALSFYTTIAGPYTFVVTGTGDVSFVGLHSQTGPYRLVVAICGQQCDSIDFNNDGLFPDTQDIDDFLSVFSGGTCSTAPIPGCNDIDFNNDGLFPDTLDIDALLSVFSGGPCL